MVELYACRDDGGTDFNTLIEICMAEGSFNLTSKIIDYETGQMTGWEILDFYSELVKSGYIKQLQGHYGRQVRHLMDEGVMDEQGNIVDTSKLTLL